MTKYFLVYHIGHGGGDFLMAAMNNFTGADIWVLGEAHQPDGLDFAGRGLNKKEHLDQELLNYFADAEHKNIKSCGIIKSFRRSAVDYVRERDGHTVQMLRNPLAKCGTRVDNLSRMGQAVPAYEKEFGHPPRTQLEYREAHFILIKNKFYEHFLHRAKKYLGRLRFPIIRLEDLNLSLGHDCRLFQRFMEWLAGISWPMSYCEALGVHYLPNMMYTHEVIWIKEEDPAVGRRRIAGIRSYPLRFGSHPNRTKSWYLDPESMLTWFGWDVATQDLYRKYFREIDKRLGYNQQYPSSVSQDWEFAGKYPWGKVYDGETAATRVYE